MKNIILWGTAVIRQDLNIIDLSTFLSSFMIEKSSFIPFQNHISNIRLETRRNRRGDRAAPSRASLERKVTEGTKVNQYKLHCTHDKGRIDILRRDHGLDKPERSTARSWTSSHHLPLACTFGTGFQASYLDVKRPNKGGVWNLDV